MRVLVTGSNGFIGSRIVAGALTRGWEAIGLGRSPAPAGPVTGYLRHDLRRPIGSGAAQPVDVVVHSAALAAPWAAPSAFEASNVDGTRHVVEWCRANGSPHLVYISSSSVLYRDEDQFDLTEESPVPPDREQINAYARTKRAGERLVAGYEGTWTVLRPRAVFGPGDTLLLPRILAAARRGLLPLLEPAAGPRVRCDLTYVDTAAHYALRAAELRTPGTFLVTNGETVEVYPFLLDVLARLGHRPRTPRVPVGVARFLAGVAEQVSARLLNYREPPLTRFGVSVLARSKTFDVTRCRGAFGEPPVGLAEGVRRLVAAHGGDGRE